MLPVPRDWSERGLLRVRRRDTPAVGQFRMADRRWIYCFCRGNPHSTKAWKNCAMTRHDPKELRPPFSFFTDDALVRREISGRRNFQPCWFIVAIPRNGIRKHGMDQITERRINTIAHRISCSIVKNQAGSNLRLDYVSLEDASILSILDITTQGKQFHRKYQWLKLRKHAIHQNSSASEYSQFRCLPPTPAVSLVCSLGLLYVSVCSWKIGSRTFPRCSRKSPEYPETDANALMRHLHPRDVTQICRVSPGHYCIYAVADISRPGQEQQEQVEARVSDGG